MKKLGLTALIASIAGCGGDGHGTTDVGIVIRLDDASDELVAVLDDMIDQGLDTVDDARAPHLTAPADDAEVPRATPITFTWDKPQSSPGPTPRHGLDTGDFVWLRLEGSGMDPVNVISLGSTSWTPDDVMWGRLTAATGAITVKLVAAHAEAGVVHEGDGPFRPTEEPSFTIAAE